MILAEPGRGVPVCLEDGADRAFLDRDDGIITWKAGRYFTDHSVPHRMMIAARNNRRSRVGEQSDVEWKFV